MKKFISGFLAGSIISFTIGIFAVSYVAEPATFKVMVNGKEFTSDPPVLVIDGNTYLPLRAMGNALGVPVTWNSELGQAEVGNSAPVAEKSQYSRNNPAPINTVQEYSYTASYATDYSATVRVLETTRGEKALKMILDSNMFNDEPKEGYEYIIAKIGFSLLSVEKDESITASIYDFDFYSSNNEEYEFASVVLDGELSTELFAGGNAEGYVVGMIKKDDPAPKLAYGLNYNGTNGIWFKL